MGEKRVPKGTGNLLLIWQVFLSDWRPILSLSFHAVFTRPGNLCHAFFTQFPHARQFVSRVFHAVLTQFSHAFPLTV